MKTKKYAHKQMPKKFTEWKNMVKTKIKRDKSVKLNT